MNIVEMLLNYLDFFKIIIVSTVILIIFVTFLLLSSDLSILNDESLKNNKKANVYSLEKKEKENEIIKHFDEIQKEQNEPKIEIKRFLKNEVNDNKFILSDKTENISHYSKILIDNRNNIIHQNDELSIMYIESLSSLNSWKNNELENKLFKEINWNLEKGQNENNDEESLVYQYVFPLSKIKDSRSSITSPNLSSSQSSVNSNSDTEDGEEEKEKALLSAYKLGICRTFECTEENKLKSNIVKEVNGCYYKVYSQGDPDLIKEKCRKETIPENYNEMVDLYKKGGYNIIGICGKKMKMNYIQSQRVERSKCESNMIFLGFVVYKVNTNDYKNAYS